MLYKLKEAVYGEVVLIEAALYLVALVRACLKARLLLLNLRLELLL